MLPLTQNKGIYPIWVTDQEIINQVLTEIIREGGRLPYSYVINPEHSPRIQARMKIILDRMEKERLVINKVSKSHFIETDIEGGKAAQLGYVKYSRIRKFHFLGRIFNSLSF